MGKRKKIRIQKFHFLVTLPIVSILIITVTIVFAYLRVNNRIFTSSLVGHVQERNGSPVKNVEVCVAEICNKTDATGFFSIQETNSGLSEIFVLSDSYEDFREKIFLQKGSNNLDIFLTPARIVSGKVVFTSSVDFSNKDLEITFNNESIKADSNNSLIFKEIKAGVYPLTVKSKKFIDEELDIVFEGSNEVASSIVLIPSVNAEVTILDFIKNTPIKNAVITTADESYETDENGVASITEIGTDEVLTISKEDFLSTDITTQEFSYRKTNTIDVKLVPEGKLAFTKKTNAGNQVFVSNIDGSEEKQLTTKGNNNNPWYDAENEIVYFTRSRNNSLKPYIFSISTTGENQVRLTEESNTKISKDLDLINYKADKRVYMTKEDDKFLLKNEKLSGEGTKTILEVNNFEVKEPILSENGNTFFYHEVPNDKESNGAFYSISTNLGLKSRITDDLEGKAKLEAVRDNNQQFLISREGQLYIYSLTTRTLNEVSRSDNKRSLFSFGNDDREIYYLENKKNIRIFQEDKEGIKPISLGGVDVVDYNRLDDDIVYYKSVDSLFITSTFTDGVNQKIVSGISVN